MGEAARRKELGDPAYSMPKDARDLEQRKEERRAAKEFRHTQKVARPGIPGREQRVNPFLAFLAMKAVK